MEGTHLVDIILAAGALGTASFGIVEGLKGGEWLKVGSIGFSKIPTELGAGVMNALKVAYGNNATHYLESLFRNSKDSGELSKTIRQGARIGLTKELASDLAESVGVIDKDLLTNVAIKLRSGDELDKDERSALGRYELALDSRIDAAIANANTKYISGVRKAASIISILISVVVGLTIAFGKENFALTNDVTPFAIIVQSIVIGIVAVPIAPIAKDIVSAIQSVSKSFKSK